MTFQCLFPWICLFVVSSCLLPQIPLAIQPLGKMVSVFLSATKAGIESLYDIKAEILPAAPLPASAYYQPRQRYRANRMLDHSRPSETSAISRSSA